MLKMRRITDVYEMKVFDDIGNYMGDIEESLISLNKVFGWRIRATRTSSLSRVLGSAKGIIVPHKFVKAIGDIMIVNKQAIPAYEEAGGVAQQQTHAESTETTI